MSMNLWVMVQGRRIYTRKDRWTDGRTEERTNGIDGQKDRGWTEGQTDRRAEALIAGRGTCSKQGGFNDVPRGTACWEPPSPSRAHTLACARTHTHARAHARVHLPIRARRRFGATGWLAIGRRTARRRVQSPGQGCPLWCICTRPRVRIGSSQ